MDDLKAIKMELSSSFEAEQLARLSFQTIWEEVQNQHGMEGEQRPWKRLKPLYKKAWEEQSKIAHELVEIEIVIKYLDEITDGSPCSTFLRPVDKAIDKTLRDLIKKKTTLEKTFGWPTEWKRR